MKENRLGVIAVSVTEKDSVPELNSILSEYGEIIVARQGLPLRERQIHLISLIIDGKNDDIGALTGKLGRLAGVQVKSMLTKV